MFNLCLIGIYAFNLFQGSCSKIPSEELKCHYVPV